VQKLWRFFPPSYLTTLLTTLLTLQTEDTFNILSRTLAQKWDECDDVVNPFGDMRQAAMTAYTFDLKKDIIFLSDASQNQQLPLNFFRNHDCPTLADFTPRRSSFPTRIKPLGVPPSILEPEVSGFRTKARFAYSQIPISNGGMF
jgi:hypothetical protein